jgi:DNA-binding NarL/FixJ family response regulator
MQERVVRVLVVDDERFFREAIRDALEAAGIRCATAAGSGEVLQHVAREASIGVVVLDVALDRGAEVLRQLREERPSIRVIVLSTHAEQERVLEALRAGAVDYLAKPLHDEELVLAVRRALAAHGTESGFERLRGRLRGLDAWLGEIAERAARGAEEVGRAATEAAADLLDASKTSLLLRDDASGDLRVVAATGSPRALHEMDPVAWGEGVAGWVAARQQALAVADVYSDDRFGARPHRAHYATGSLAVAPLHRGEETLGVLCATYRNGGVTFGDDELSILKVLALHASLLLASHQESAPASTEAEEISTAHGRDAELARQVCDAMAVEVEPPRLLAAALRHVARGLSAAPVSLYMIDNRSGDLALESQNDDEGVADRPRLPRDRGLTATVLQTGGLVATARPQADPRFDPLVDTPADGVPAPLLCVPLRLRGVVLGVARIFPKDEAAASARTGEVLSSVLSAAIRNVLMYRSLLESIEDVARARREAGNARAR